MLIYEADRHAKKELKKKVRGVRALERSVNNPNEPITEVMQGYCKRCAIALTDDGRPPLDASGLRLQQRLNAIEQSLERVAQKGLALAKLKLVIASGLFANYLALDPDYYCL